MLVEGERDEEVVSRVCDHFEPPAFAREGMKRSY